MRLVGRLGPYTHTGRAIADDDDLQRDREARLGVEMARARQRRPRLTDWDQFDELRATINDAAERIAVNAARTAGVKPPPRFRPTTRPRSAAERAEEQADVRVAQEIMAEATPWARPVR